MATPSDLTPRNYNGGHTLSHFLHLPCALAPLAVGAIAGAIIARLTGGTFTYNPKDHQ